MDDLNNLSQIQQSTKNSSTIKTNRNDKNKDIFYSDLEENTQNLNYQIVEKQANQKYQLQQKQNKSQRLRKGSVNNQQNSNKYIDFESLYGRARSKSNAANYNQIKTIDNIQNYTFLNLNDQQQARVFSEVRKMTLNNQIQKKKYDIIKLKMDDWDKHKSGTYHVQSDFKLLKDKISHYNKNWLLNNEYISKQLQIQENTSKKQENNFGQQQDQYQHKSKLNNNNVKNNKQQEQGKLNNLQNNNKSQKYFDVSENCSINKSNSDQNLDDDLDNDDFNDQKIQQDLIQNLASQSAIVQNSQNDEKNYNSINKFLLKQSKSQEEVQNDIQKSQKKRKYRIKVKKMKIKSILRENPQKIENKKKKNKIQFNEDVYIYHVDNWKEYTRKMNYTGENDEFYFNGVCQSEQNSVEIYNSQEFLDQFKISSFNNLNNQNNSLQNQNLKAEKAKISNNSLENCNKKGNLKKNQRTTNLQTQMGIENQNDNILQRQRKINKKSACSIF